MKENWEKLERNVNSKQKETIQNMQMKEKMAANERKAIERKSPWIEKGRKLEPENRRGKSHEQQRPKKACRKQESLFKKLQKHSQAT